MDNRGIFGLRVAIGVLALSAGAKLFSAFGSTEALDLSDPLFPLSNRSLMWFIAAVELLVAGLLCSQASNFFKLTTVVWLAANFANYRLWTWIMNVQNPCPCMGEIYEVVGLTSSASNVIGILLMVLLLAWSGYHLLVIMRCNPSTLALAD